jgi:hypothetical protein
MKTIVLVVFGFVLIRNVVASGGRYASVMLKLGKVLIAGFLTEMHQCPNCPHHLPGQCLFGELCICMLYRELGLTRGRRSHHFSYGMSSVLSSSTVGC